MADVFFNGKIVGSVANPQEFVTKIKSQRRKGKLTSSLNIAYDEALDIVNVLTEEGRLRRPLIIVENGKSRLTPDVVEKIKKGEIKWSDLIKENIVEFMDAEEEENALIAFDESELTPEHTHLEIVKSAIYGSQASLIVFPEHNGAGRVTLGAKMLTQGQGVYATNYNLRLDSDVSVMHYPQKPIVDTIMYKNVNYEGHPVGQNIVIAVMTHEGYNMDDAIVINKHSVDMGIFRSTFFKPYNCEELRYAGGIRDVIEIPSKDTIGRRMDEDYTLLESDGVIYPEAKVGEGKVLIGKTSPPRFLSGMEEFRVGVEARHESSVAATHDDGIVDAVMITESEEGNKYINVRLRQPKNPELGDKFASRHGQKGVIGLMVPKADMPFTADGMVPDIIFSPHGIPSRMTVGQLIEIIAGKVGALGGRYVDGTAFTGEDEYDLRKELHKLGFRENGAETMYDGKTGRMLNVRIFVGDIYYMRLKYMVSNKYHMRTRGPVQLLTRQPTEGRAKEGGLRLGEMEKDVLVAHGASLLLKERFDSDKTVVPVCKKCGLIAMFNHYRNKGMCPVDGEDAPVTFLEMSYAFKLLLDELKSLCIYPKLNIKYKD
ncbi:DNA-directed RNA polymerase subunit B' [Candidatus Tiddalikarchaeum anstoanum]|nr:DNA-directed RNA polymerase subunit B' [Candidatus Tiddalikarchaeum anstoanum]